MFLQWLQESPKAAIANYHKLNGLKTTHLFPEFSGDEKSAVSVKGLRSVLSGLLPLEAPEENPFLALAASQGCGSSRAQATALHSLLLVSHQLL